MGAKVSGQVVDITSSEGVVYDSVINWHTQCYSYNVLNELKDFRIKVESYAGDPDVYINPGSGFPPLQSFKFNSRDHF